MTVNYHQSYIVEIDGTKKFLRINKELSAGNIFECLVTNEDGTKWELRLISKDELKGMFNTKKREKLEVK